MAKKEIIVGVVTSAIVAALVGVSILQPLGQAQAKSYELVAREFSFNGLGYNEFTGGPELRVNVGDTVTITLRNGGGVDHEIMVITEQEFEEMMVEMAGKENEVEEQGEHIDESKHEESARHPEPAFVGAMIHDLEPGQIHAMTFVADKLGRYVYACFYEEPIRHLEAGMHGIFVVT